MFDLCATLNTQKIFHGLLIMPVRYDTIRYDTILCTSAVKNWRLASLIQGGPKYAHQIRGNNFVNS